MLVKLNDVLAFVLELASIVLLVRWSFSIERNLFIKILLAIVLVAIFAVVWGMFFSPKAPYALEGMLRWVLQFIILFIPYLQFARSRPWLLAVGAILIFVNLFIQANYGSAEWGI